MKTAMSNIDIRMIMPELKESVEGAFIKNIYQYGDIFVLKLYLPSGGTSQLLIQLGQRIHFTDYRRVAPRVPPKFAAVLRKYLRDKKVYSIRQHELDRIVVIEVGDEESSYKLVAELFGNGNLLLLDPEDSIFVAMHYRRMKDRDLIPKAKYEFPPPRGVDILTNDDYSLADLIADSNANIVRTLASRLNLDSQSCEEICALAGMSGTLKVQDLGEKELKELEAGVTKFVQKVRHGISNPCIVEELELEEEDNEEIESGYEVEPVAYIPFEHEIFQSLDCRPFEQFSRAIDEYFGVSETELEDEVAQSALDKEKNRLQKIIDKQQEGIDILAEKGEHERIRGEMIYASFQTVQEVLDTINTARTNGRSWSEIINIIENGKAQGNATALLISRITPSQGEIVVDLHDVEVTLDIRLSAQENASRAYDYSKKARSKIEGAKKQIEKTKLKMDKLEADSLDTTTVKKAPVRVRKKRWYEKFRWFISSQGYLILGGRDAKSNERLAKRHMTANDIFLHASVHGAPYVIVKVPDEPPDEKTLEEAAQFAVTFSRAWQDGMSSGDAYWLSPEQVSFTPPSGEYLPSGGVMMYGNKNYINNVPVELAVGIILEDDNMIPMSGPSTAVETHCNVQVRIKPSEDKKGQLVKEIINALRRSLPEEQQSLIDQIPQEDIMRVLPPGGGRLVK
ncbi:MAG: ribosome rescue protein RqcH [Candidatus Thorarchaeota archaeon]